MQSGEIPAKLPRPEFPPAGTDRLWRQKRYRGKREPQHEAL